MKDLKLNQGTLNWVLQEIRKLSATGKTYRISSKIWSEKRSLPANSIYYAWIPAISDYIGYTVPETTRLIKLDFGLPIVLNNEVGTTTLLDKLNKFRFFELSREEQLEAMDLFPVTSLMTTKQHNTVRDNILHHFQTMGVNIGYED